MILTLRTDKPEAEIGLFENGQELTYEKWQAHRQLSETIHSQIAKNLQFVGKELGDIAGIVVFKGPGSYTGLRIGMSVANALACSLNCPIIGTTGDDWITQGTSLLSNKKGEKTSKPEYEHPAKTTQPRK